MGTDLVEVEATPCQRDIKVHRLMCQELMILLNRVSKIFPEIEAARPRCSAGLQALCLLNSAIEKAKLVLEHCRESSRLYLAITGDAILSRCKRTKNLLDQGLSQIQNMVPVPLAVEISRIVFELRSAKFSLNSSEEEAGKVVRTYLQRCVTATDSMEQSAIETIQFAASRLQITSQKGLVTEKRSIKNLLGKVGDGDRGKKQILVYLLNLLNNYGHVIGKERTENAFVRHEESFSCAASCEQSNEVESRVKYEHNEAQPDMLSRPMLPEEFLCPLSLRLMYDPVIIASEQTFERMWIQKWFDEGNDTCPKTNMKLAHFSLTPNAAIKNLISKWCMAYGVTVTDPFIQSAEIQPWEASSSSIASLKGFMNDLRVDVSIVSLESLDTSYNSDSSSFNNPNGLNLMSEQRNDDSHRIQSQENAHGIDVMFLSELDALSWESQCEAVENVKSHLNNDDQACCLSSAENFVEPLIKFLKQAHDINDIKALRAGSQLLLAFVTQCRSSIRDLPEYVYNLLASLLDSEVTEETLAIMEVLSCHQFCRSKIAASGALASILSIFESKMRKYQERAIKILYNLSFNNDICSLIVSSEFIPKLVPLFEDTALARYCISILSNLCNKGDARASVAETEGCIASIVKLLESDSQEEQEHAVTVLLSLCSQRVQYCQLVMDEGVIPALFSISVNGNDKGKASAMELLRLLRDIEYSDLPECGPPVSNLDFSRETTNHNREQKSSSRASKFFGMKLSMFSKSSSLTPKKKK